MLSYNHLPNIMRRLYLAYTHCTIITRHGTSNSGLSLNYAKVVPSTALGFTVYDYLKTYLDVRGNML